MIGLHGDGVHPPSSGLHRATARPAKATASSRRVGAASWLRSHSERSSTLPIVSQRLNTQGKTARLGETASTPFAHLPHSSSMHASRPGFPRPTCLTLASDLHPHERQVIPPSTD